MTTHHHYHSERSDVRRKPKFPRLEVMQRRRRDERLLMEDDMVTLSHPNRGSR